LIVGASEPMLELVEQIKQVGPSDVSVIITGESGTGKELVAQAVHRESRCSGPFVAVNCGGLTSELVASELFGHEKGSFTGANKRHLGSFERAEDGTLFLDEISEMPMDQQPHLLRALESRAITRVGGEADIAYNARIISASNRDLADAVHAGHLREDLYFRLSVYPLHIPPLRERKADIKPLAEMFLHNLNSRHDSDMELDERALNALESWHWPGNVRELKHAMHRCYILTKDKSGALHVPADFGFDLSNGAGNGIEAGRSIRDVEHDLITKTLKHFDGNRKAAAEVLGISLKTLYNRLSEYNEDA
jgi:DNA-binding NtrC family response regulator